MLDVKITQQMSKISTQVEKRPSNIACVEIISFAESEKVVLFKKKNFKVAVSTGLKLLHFRLTTCTLDTSACPNLIRVDLLGLSWERRIHQRDLPDITSASSPRLKKAGTIMLYL